MSRTTIRNTYKDLQATNQGIEKVLLSHNYKNINENGENVWKNGIGFWTAMKYIKIEYADASTVVISGWIRPMGGSDMNLEGFVGAIPKKQVMNVIKEIQAAIV